VPRDNFYRTVYDRFYGTASNADTVESHDLALLYMILAVGLQTDPRVPLNSPDAVRYFHLSRAALTLDPPLQEHTLTAVQVMVCPLPVWAGCVANAPSCSW
jgi:hypothetical protein